jgi:hypothetical protein
MMKKYAEFCGKEYIIDRLIDIDQLDKFMIFYGGEFNQGLTNEEALNYMCSPESVSGLAYGIENYGFFVGSKIYHGEFWYNIEEAIRYSRGHLESFIVDDEIPSMEYIEPEYPKEFGEYFVNYPEKLVPFALKKIEKILVERIYMDHTIATLNLIMKITGSKFFNANILNIMIQHFDVNWIYSDIYLYNIVKCIEILRYIRKHETITAHKDFILLCQ